MTGRYHKLRRLAAAILLTLLIGIPFLRISGESAFRFDICGSVTEDVPPNPQGVITKTIPGGRCAVVRHLGSRDRVAESIYPLYREWLPQSGEALRDFPLFFDYLNLSPEAPENALITDIYLPLK